MFKRLSTLLENISYSCAETEIYPAHCKKEQAADPEISSLVFDSRDVKTGALFFALPGTHIHGNTYIPQAVKNGAAAIFFQDTISGQLLDDIQNALAARAECGGTETLPAFIKVADTRFAMSPVADVFFDRPSAKLAVIGITGTEGKSTTVFLVWQLLRLCGKKAGFISTVQYSVGNDAVDNSEHQTTPEAPIVQKRLADMVANGCEYAVIEASSHGLSVKTNRLGDVRFDAAAMMNVTSEHLEFHGTLDQYKSDKANLFRALDKWDHTKTINGAAVAVPSFGVVNMEDAATAYFTRAVHKPVFGFMTEKAASEETRMIQNAGNIARYMRASRIAGDRNGVSFFAEEPGSAEAGCAVRINLPGNFNVYNTMAAMILTARLLGTGTASLKPAAEQLIPVKGRMTVIRKGQPFEVIVDYAHTPSSFGTIFPPLRKRAPGHIICVFGSGGERDTQKRPEQGRIAAQYCDTVILADEDPRNEDPLSILEMIAAGIPPQSKIRGESLFLIPDRPSAIRKAFALAQPDDIVLLLGKSHENSIIYKDHTLPYDEISEAEKALAEIGYTEQ